MFDLAVVKSHLRVDHDDEDALIQAYTDAALAAFEDWTNRKLVAADDQSETPENAAVMTASIQQGALLLIGQWYANREAVLTGSIVTSFPMATRALWMPHRWTHL